jgi:hypothetical protein
LSIPSTILPEVPQAGAPRGGPQGLSPFEALAAAWGDTLRLLLSPLDTRRWILLSLVCLFLGGGTPTAAFQWSLSSLPVDFKLGDIFEVARSYIIRNMGLSILAIVLGLGLAVALLYVRSTFRFILVDALLRKEVYVREAWRELWPLGESYFFWLLGTLASLAVVFSAVVISVFPHLRAAAASENRTLVISLLLLTLLAFVVLLGLLVALLIMLTDDLVVPVMYAERTHLPAAWRKLAGTIRREPRALLVYAVLRFLVSVGVGAAVLLFLFPILVTVFSGAIIIAALVVLTLHLVGAAWAWNTLTILLATAAALALSGVLLIVLGVVGMPGQVFIQDFGLRFIASRVPAFEPLWRLSCAHGRSQ